MMTKLYNFQKKASLKDDGSQYWNIHYCVNQPGDSSGEFVKVEDFIALRTEREALAKSSDYHILKVAELDQQLQASRAEVEQLREATAALIAYRDQVGPLGFQLEKADDFIEQLRAALAGVDVLSLCLK